MSIDTGLANLLQSHFSAWLGRDGHQQTVAKLGVRQAQALANLLTAELSGASTSQLRDERIDDLRQFDFGLNQLAGGLLMELDASRAQANATNLPSYDLDRSLFAGAVSNADVQAVVGTLQKNGYSPSPVGLNRQQLDQVFSALRKRQFATKGVEPRAISGADLLSKVAQTGTPGLQDGDTFWLSDYDNLVHDEFLFRLAFDPFILAVATGYFGCAPVHAQTNAWFSFQSARFKNNLSSNAQMYHQDKEFVKFLKVFIYLTDVDENSGPHKYVEASHLDELHRKGQDISERVSDEDIAKYYDPSRIRTVTGPAGLMVFGDTSSVHKGTPVLSGYRAMLQFEYTTSLYLSPVAPFSDVLADKVATIPLSGPGRDRLTANYSSTRRAAFVDHEKRSRPSAPQSNGLLTFARKIKRRVQSLATR